MKVLITGASGQLGSALQSELRDDVLSRFNHADLDITDRALGLEAVGRLKPDLIINAAAYNFVDKAETDQAAAFAANETGPRNLAEAASDARVPLVHVSTDYVFDGTL